jgi:hypothetical protein
MIFMGKDDMTEEAVSQQTPGEQMYQKLDLVIHLLMDIQRNTRQATGLDCVDNGARKKKGRLSKTESKICAVTSQGGSNKTGGCEYI